MSEYTEIKNGCTEKIMLSSVGIRNDSKCAREVGCEPTCGKAFFYSPPNGSCYCEKNGSNCVRSDSDKYNEYRLYTGG